MDHIATWPGLLHQKLLIVWWMHYGLPELGHGEIPYGVYMTKRGGMAGYWPCYRVITYCTSTIVNTLPFMGLPNGGIRGVPRMHNKCNVLW